MTLRKRKVVYLEGGAMFATGHYHFNHNSIGKTTHSPDYIGQAISYVCRSTACEKLITLGGIIPNRHALIEWATQHQASLRKNARVADRFNFSLPRDLTPRQRHDIARAFAWAVSDGGRAPCILGIHHDKADNPHAHMLFFDYDPDTKRKVQQLSKRGSTERMRALWETVANNKLSEWGYDIRIDRRTLEAQHAQALEYGDREAQEILERRLERKKGRELTMALIQDETQEPYALPLQQRLHAFMQAQRDYQMLKQVRQEVETLRAAMPILDSRAAQAADALTHTSHAAANAKAEANIAQQHAQQFLDANGDIDAFRLKLPFGITLASRRYREAETSLRAVQQAKDALAKAQYLHERDQQAAEHARQQKEQAQEALQAREELLQAWGSEQDVTEAEQNMRDVANYHYDTIREQELMDESVTEEQRRAYRQHQQIFERDHGR